MSGVLGSFRFAYTFIDAYSAHLLHTYSADFFVLSDDLACPYLMSPVKTRLM